MSFDFFRTYNLIRSIREIPPVRTFLRDRYFPTNDATDLFSTDDVLVEYMNGRKRIAPFVAPRKGGIVIKRDGYHVERYAPPRIAPKREITIDELRRRGFGEALFSELTPQQREAAMLIQDMEDLRCMIRRREEAMAAELLINNGYVMKHYADDTQKVAEEKEIRFYSEAANPAQYIPAIDWDQEGSKKMADLAVMTSMLTPRGLPATEVLVAPDVADLILEDKEIQRLLDLRNYEIGTINPSELGNGVSEIANLNVKGRRLTFLCYEETYENEEGVLVPYIPQGHIVLTAPAVGRTLYGAVSQVEQSDGQVHTYTGRYIPKFLTNADADMRSVTVNSCPLLIPNHKNAWITAKVA